MANVPYDIINTAITAAKTRLGDSVDTLAAVGGKLLDNTQPFTQQICNSAFRKMQQYLMELGYTGMKQETLIPNLPACTTTDTSAQVALGYTGYFDGTVLQTAPVLPQNLVRPLDMWERIFVAGTNISAFLEMDVIQNGLPGVPKSLWNRQWEWRDDTIYMPGTTDATDLRIRFFGFFSDFVDVSGSPGPNQLANTPWFGQPIPVMQCIDSLADYICREINISRDRQDAAVLFEESARANAQLILNRDSAQPKAILKASEFGKMQDRYTPGLGGNTQPIKRGGTPQ